jgi:hypothetical protein
MFGELPGTRIFRRTISMKLLKLLPLILVILSYSLSVVYAFQYFFTTPKQQVKIVLKILYPGDINRDGIINLLDLNYIAFNWGKTVPPAPAKADLNGDGIINLLDLNPIAFNWNKHI